jgi:hypothetical protein
MYYVAVMDCEDNLHKIMGDNPFNEMSIEAVLTADKEHLPYEKQGII